MTIFVELLVLLVLTRAFGEAAGRLGQPASVGEIVAGILLAAGAAWMGPDLPFLAQLVHSDVLESAANLGIFFLVLLAGIELEPREIARGSAVSFAVALGGMILPLLGGFALAWAFLPASDLRLAQALLTGVALSISAIPATVKVLSELNLLHTRTGETIVAAAVFDDVLGLFLLAALLAVIKTGHVPDLETMVWLVLKVGLFFAVTVSLGVHVYPRISRGIRALQAAAIEFSAMAAVGLAYGLLAEVLGLHWILGAFMAGLYFEKSRVGLRAYNEMKLVCGTVTSGALGPLFFAYIGLRVDLSAIAAIPVFILLLILVAFLGKLAGAGLPAHWAGLGSRHATAVGVGMSTRGAVELVVLSIAYESGLFAASDGTNPVVENLFSALILMAVVTTILSPVLLKRILASGPPTP